MDDSALRLYARMSNTRTRVMGTTRILSPVRKLSSPIPLGNIASCTLASLVHLTIPWCVIEIQESSIYRLPLGPSDYYAVEHLLENTQEIRPIIYWLTS